MTLLHLQIRCLVLFLLGCSAAAQSAAPSVLSLDQLHARAGIIFSGTVLRVETHRSVIHVTYRVDEAIRGAFSGQDLTLSEWKRSATAAPRYLVGERLLVFFHSPSPNGLTSPVGGTAGVIRFDDADTLKLTAEQINMFHRALRLRGATGEPSVGSARVPAADFVRALRLFAASP